MWGGLRSQGAAAIPVTHEAVGLSSMPPVWLGSPQRSVSILTFMHCVAR